MDRRDYTDQVLSSLRRVTEKEREAIRSELDGHIEDHMEALRELGIDYQIVTGTSIGALNGALMVQNDFEAAKSMWEGSSVKFWNSVLIRASLALAPPIITS